LARCRAHDRSPTSCLRSKLIGQPGTSSSGGVGGAGGNTQFHFRAGIDFAPYCQLASYQLGAFPHTGQAIVSLNAMTRENRRINAFSVVTHTQSELLLVIADFNLDLPCLGVPKRIPQCFGSNFIHFVTENGMQISRLALNGYTECRSVAG